MSKVDLGAIGISLNVSGDDRYLAEAAEIEQLGYSAIWLPGGQIDTLDRIAATVNATTHIRVVPGIIALDVYSSAEVIRLFAQLEASAPGRFVVGLGGPQRPPRLSTLARYLDELDDAEPPVPAQRRLLAALGPRKLEVARERAAGVVTLLVTPAYTAEVRRALGERSMLVVDQLVVLDDDPKRARETARGSIRFLSGVAGYRANFARMGFTDVDIADVTDRLVDELVVWGDAEQIANRVDEHRAAGADHVVLGVLSEGQQPGPLDVARRLAARVLGSPISGR
jgi:probable F420-dependent oxidoreductase